MPPKPPRPDAPGTRIALLVSHGQPSEPQVGEDEIAALAAAVSEHAPGWDIRGATLAAPGALEAALVGTPKAAPLYPMFIADGWFTQSALPKRLDGAPVRQMNPFGMDPGLPAFAADWLRREIAAAGWRPENTALFIAGHGSGRSPRPAAVTRDFADALTALLPLREIRCGFVEEAPSLEDMAAGLGDKAICLPFFAAKRGHVLDDVPEALDAVGFTGLRLDPIGCHPGIPALIARRLTEEPAEVST
ncbi:cobalamin biosynthesis protein CbiX [Thalassococcus sp. CAU 1522]|uniref:Cobalamin biosynthesis protein CbiX n=2 Tax=Thalassococcus arenae TaxID=2851652 RepID=A0ABS6NCF2_9RHOB|nr:cobalamin biosynthesis protein CbiX [Thalassococcus arenae]